MKNDNGNIPKTEKEDSVSKSVYFHGVEKVTSNKKRVSL